MPDIEGALEKYDKGEISTERLAEELGVNYFVLHGALRRGCQLFKPQPDTERIYPCDDCGKMRSQNEGGTVFTVCDECWATYILSYPDLALIDREKFARHILVRTYNPGWYPVIPLAEAIKEKGEDKDITQH